MSVAEIRNKQGGRGSEVAQIVKEGYIRKRQGREEVGAGVLAGARTRRGPPTLLVVQSSNPGIANTSLESVHLRHSLQH